MKKFKMAVSHPNMFHALVLHFDRLSDALEESKEYPTCTVRVFFGKTLVATIK